ncbi:hypothetical protein MKX01_015367 [Papaver californicum]|nr:hypothetical protein MKX01_015367 [Papaver californicum]
MSIIRALFLVFLLHSAVKLLVSAQRSTKKASSWKTLSGNEPLVIARGGFSGLFPDSSTDAYSIAMITSSPNVVLWCDVQLTKDGIGICLPDLKLDNSTNIEFVSPNTSSTYIVNGVSTKGWFSVDYDMNFLQKNNVFLTRGIFSRKERFDGTGMLIMSISSYGATLPSTNQTYGSLLKNLSRRLPLEFLFLRATSGLYNYSYNPLSEYLSFVDNDDFSVDDVLSDFPITTSAAIGCFAHMDNSSSGQGDSNCSISLWVSLCYYSRDSTFNLTWEEIKTLKHNMQHAAYLAEKQGLGVTDAVIDVLNKSGYKNQTAQEVIIQSMNKAALTMFKAQSGYKRMYMVDEDISSIDDSSIKDIKSFADSVAIGKESIFPSELLFLTGSTKVVPRLHSFNLSVYAYLFRNEFVSQAWDFFSDPIVEINSYVMGGEIDGVITDFPATAASYRNSRCLRGKTLPPYMMPAQPGNLLQVVTPQYLPPAEAPNPILTEADVSEPPLPPVSKKAASDAPTPSKSNAYIGKMAGFYFSSLSMFLASLLLLIV